MRRYGLFGRIVAGGCYAIAFLFADISSTAGQEAAEDVRYAEQMPLADDTLVLDASATVSGAVAVGTRGHVLLSEDFESWRQAGTVPTRATLTAVEFVENEGWAVGHDSVILHTTDGGETWERQYHDPDRQQPFMDVLFLDSERGFAVGAYDLFMTTTDGGATWRDTGGIDDADDWHLNDIVRLRDGTILIAAEQGLVYRSTDDAQSWEVMQMPYHGSMFGILEPRPNVALAFGLRGNAFRTDDGGATWTAEDTDTTASLFGGAVLENGEVILVGNAGTVTRRSPGVEEFRSDQHPDGESLAGVLEAPSGELVYFGLSGIGVSGEPVEGPANE